VDDSIIDTPIAAAVDAFSGMPEDGFWPGQDEEDMTYPTGPD
jgi:hypothetical protein